MALTIQQEVEDRIFSAIGFPVIDETDLEVSLEFLRNNCIYPAMKEYFRYFPIKKRDNVTVSGEFEITFPDLYTYYITNARLHSAGYNNNTSYTGSPFFNERLVNNSGNYSKYYGGRQDISDILPSLRAEKQTRVNMNRQWTVRVDEQEQKVKGFTNINGTLEVEWAKWSDDWADISFIQEENVIKLAMAYVLDYFGGIRGQETSDIPVQFDADAFMDTAKQLREKVYEVWKAKAKPVVIRG